MSGSSEKSLSPFAAKSWDQAFASIAARAKLP